MNRGQYPRYISAFIAMVSLAGLCQAQQAPSDCTVSGQRFVIQDTNGNSMIDVGGDQWFTMKYNGNNMALDVYQQTGMSGMAGMVGSYPASESDSAVMLTIDGGGASVAKTCGSPAFNSADVTAWYGQNNAMDGMPMVNAMLVDTNNDRMVDSISLLLDFLQYPQLAGVLFDMKLQYTSYMGVAYVLIPDPIPTPVGGLYIGGAWFIPVDRTNGNMVLQCGDEFGPDVIDDQAYINANRNCITNTPARSIPVGGGWASAFMVLGLLIAGIWAMRRGGMGKGIGLS